MENREPLEKLAALGVNYAQGYVAGKPYALEVQLKAAGERDSAGVSAKLFSAA